MARPQDVELKERLGCIWAMTMICIEVSSIRFVVKAAIGHQKPMAVFVWNEPVLSSIVEQIMLLRPICELHIEFPFFQMTGNAGDDFGHHFS